MTEEQAVQRQLSPDQIMHGHLHFGTLNLILQILNQMQGVHREINGLNALTLNAPIGEAVRALQQFMPVVPEKQEPAPRSRAKSAAKPGRSRPAPKKPKT